MSEHGRMPSVLSLNSVAGEQESISHSWADLIQFFSCCLLENSKYEKKLILLLN